MLDCGECNPGLWDLARHTFPSLGNQGSSSQSLLPLARASRSCNTLSSEFVAEKKGGSRIQSMGLEPRLHEMLRCQVLRCGHVRFQPPSQLIGDPREQLAGREAWPSLNHGGFRWREARTEPGRSQGDETRCRDGSSCFHYKRKAQARCT